MTNSGSEVTHEDGAGSGGEPTTGEPFALFGHDLFGDPVVPKGRGPLAERFEFPPFSVLDARSGEWQERKRAWLSLGIESEIGRGRFNYASPQAARLAGGYLSDDGKQKPTSDSSVFDPVLCELSYRWFCPPGGMVLDPFAGGSVRGIVAALLGYGYHGIELRAEQVAANEAQRSAILSGAEPAPAWICADARDALPSAPAADLVFTCPPYGDLERYSDDPRDLSALSHEAFGIAYRAVIAAAVARLRPDRFAAIVVGEYRDRTSGLYRGFIPFTWAAFEAAGARYYNEAVLVTPAGSLPVRAGKQFAAGRKLGKTHQQLLVFVKGDPRAAARACGEI